MQAVFFYVISNESNIALEGVGLVMSFHLNAVFLFYETKSNQCCLRN